jgi:hypothetical protein
MARARLTLGQKRSGFFDRYSNALALLDARNLCSKRVQGWHELRG